MKLETFLLCKTAIMMLLYTCKFFYHSYHSRITFNIILSISMLLKCGQREMWAVVINKFDAQAAQAGEGCASKILHNCISLVDLALVLLPLRYSYRCNIFAITYCLHYFIIIVKKQRQSNYWNDRVASRSNLCDQMIYWAKVIYINKIDYEA